VGLGLLTLPLFWEVANVAHEADEAGRVLDEENEYSDTVLKSLIATSA